MLKRTGVLFRKIENVGKYVPPSERAVKQHLDYEKTKKRNNRIGKFIQYTALGLVSGSILMYLWQPWNPYSKPVSQELRKGLWKERDGVDDFLMALKHYQNALDEAKAENMNQLSLNYTGIVLKIAEMYGKLKMTEQQSMTYFNLGNFIFENLIHGNIPKDDPERELLIDRDLIVITRWAMLNQQFKGKKWIDEINTELKDRIEFIEGHEMKDTLPWLISDDKLKGIDEIELIEIWANDNNMKKIFKSSKEKWIEKNITSKEGQEFLSCWNILRSYQDKKWPLWVQSYLKLRDFHAMLEMRKGNLTTCIQVLQSNLLWLVIGGFDDTVNGTTQIVNIASAWFQLGQLKNDNTCYDKSRMIYEKLLSVVDENDPILPMTNYSLGVLYLEQNKRDLAEKYFNRAKIQAIELHQLQIIDKIDNEYLRETKV